MKKIVYLFPLLLLIFQTACHVDLDKDEDNLGDITCSPCNDDDDDNTVTDNDTNNDDDPDISTSGCDLADLDHYIRADYTNYGTPTLSDISSSNDIEYDEAFAEQNENGEVEVHITGIRVDTDLDLLATDIHVRECDNNICDCEDWEEDSELSSTNSISKTNLVVSLVLDMSASMSENMEDLKEYAKDFSKEILTQSSDNHVSIITFSEVIQSHSFENIENLSSIEDAIDDFDNYGNKTKLYEAVAQGLKNLQDTDLEGHKTLVVFTDGQDNDSDNPNSLVNQITNSEIPRFGIGLESDDYNSAELAEITTTTTSVDDTEDLEDAFEQVNGQVQQVFDINYKRSDQLLDQIIKINVGFDID